MRQTSSSAKSRFLKSILGLIVVLTLFAILIPNLLRSQMTADPAPGQVGVWNVRTIATAEITYATNYEKMGYAPTLAALGPAGNGECGPEHACLLDSHVGCPQDTGQEWCVYEGYRFNVQTGSNESPYKDYWVTATPIEANPKLKNYCTTETAIIRMGSTEPLSHPYTREECLALPPLN